MNFYCNIIQYNVCYEEHFALVPDRYQTEEFLMFLDVWCLYRYTGSYSSTFTQDSLQENFKSHFSGD